MTWATPVLNPSVIFLWHIVLLLKKIKHFDKLFTNESQPSSFDYFGFLLKCILDMEARLVHEKTTHQNVDLL